jgi:hypothetical protein
MMNPADIASPSRSRGLERSGLATRPAVISSVALAALMALPATSEAVEFGIFSLNGFVKYEATRVSDYCNPNACQVADPDFVSKQFFFADDLVQGVPYGATTTNVTLIQPYLGMKLDLPQGFKLEGLISQRWRDGNYDFPGFWYERNLGVSHEEYGSLRVGAMTTRGWSLADYPYGSNLNLSSAWGSSGSGYGLLTRAIRYTSPVFDVYEGDLVLEGTYDIGEKGWSDNKPRFWEFWGHYGRGPLAVDVIMQNGKNGTPSAFSQGPFTGLMAQKYASVADPLLGGSSQGIAMIMARYQVNSTVEVSGGVRANRWSGAYAKFLFSENNNPFGNFDLWNNPFNVNWNNEVSNGVWKGYKARSTDFLLGARYFMGQWIASTGMVYLGTANTSNPDERGQSNSALINTVGLSYDLRNGLVPYVFAGMVHYKQKGLSPMSMPSNSAFTQIDSRLEKSGNWIGLGATYTF